MFPLHFDSFLERGISTIDASVKELQNTYDEVVWGTSSDGPATATATATSARTCRPVVTADCVPLRRGRSAPQTITTTTTRNNSTRKNNNSRNEAQTQPTPHTHTHVHQQQEQLRQQHRQQQVLRRRRRRRVGLGFNNKDNDNDDKESDDDESDDESGSATGTSVGDDTSATTTSVASSTFYSFDDSKEKKGRRTGSSIRARSTRRRRRRGSSRARSDGRRRVPVPVPVAVTPSPTPTPTPSSLSSFYHQKQQKKQQQQQQQPHGLPLHDDTNTMMKSMKKKKKKGKEQSAADDDDHPHQRHANNTIDDAFLFGDNTRQHITQTKSYVGEQVGLDFMVVDYPPPTVNSDSTSFLIVSNIQAMGLFSNTSLTVGDAILEINGISFQPQQQQQQQQQQQHGEKKSQEGDRQRHSVYRANKLINGKVLEINIVYQKFAAAGDTNDTSSLVSAITSVPSVASTSFVFDEKEEEEKKKKEEEEYYNIEKKIEPKQKQRRIHFGSTRSKRDSQERSTTAVAVAAAAAVSKTTTITSSEHSRSERTATTTRSTSIRGDSFVVAAGAAGAGASRSRSRSRSRSSRAASPVEKAPPVAAAAASTSNFRKNSQISRLTRLRARTQQLRVSGQKKLEASKKMLSLKTIKENNNQHKKKMKNTTTKNNHKGKKKKEKTSSASLPFDCCHDDLILKNRETNVTPADENGDSILHSCHRGVVGVLGGGGVNNDGVCSRSTTPTPHDELVGACVDGVLCSLSTTPDTNSSLLDVSKDEMNATAALSSSSSSFLPTPAVRYDAQIQLLKQRMLSKRAGYAMPTTTTFSSSKRDDVVAETQQAQTQTHTTPHPTALLDDTSVCTMDHYESIVQKYHPHGRKENNHDDIMIGNTTDENTSSVLSIGNDYHQQELIRINRKVFDKLHGRIDRLKQSNIQLTEELTELRRHQGSSHDEESSTSPSQIVVVEKYQAEIELLRSRYEISIIQSDKRQKEALQSIATLKTETQHTIVELSQRIETLEETKQQLSAQLVEQQQQLIHQKQQQQQQQEEKTKQKNSNNENNRNDVQVQMERLKIKFTAQSRLLDNVMTANETLTLQKKELEGALQQSHSQQTAAGSNANANTNTNATVAIVELTKYKARNEYLEERIAKLSSCNGYVEGGRRDRDRDQRHQHQQQQQQQQHELLSQQQQQQPQQERSTRIGSTINISIRSEDPNNNNNNNDNNNNNTNTNTNSARSGDNPSNNLPSDEDQANNEDHDHDHHHDPYFSSSSTDTTIDYLKEPIHALSSPPDHHPQKQQQPQQHTNNTKRNNEERMVHTNHNNTKPPLLDESFDSVSSLVLIEKIIELENTLQERDDMTEEERSVFISALQSRVNRLVGKGYVRDGKYRNEPAEIIYDGERTSTVGLGTTTDNQQQLEDMKEKYRE